MMKDIKHPIPCIRCDGDTLFKIHTRAIQLIAGIQSVVYSISYLPSSKYIDCINFYNGKSLETETLLKGHCHAIWQLDEKLQSVFASTEFQK